MGKYLKKFEIISQYNAYTADTENFVLPNISFTVDSNTVHYNPYVPPFFCKLILNNGKTVELEGSDELTSAMTSNYKSTLVGAEIGTQCTSIGDFAFSSCSGLTSITIGSAVTSIGSYAFYGCNGLTSIGPVGSGSDLEIPSGVTIIDSHAFDNCSGLTSVTIPDSVTSIGSSSFSSCKGLTSITIGSGVTSIGSYAFYGCNGLTSIGPVGSGSDLEIPNNVTSIGSRAFYFCSGLTSVTIPDSVTSIGDDYLFSDCISLTSVTIGNGVTRIGYGDFSNCSGLTSITIGSGVTSIGSSVFYDCSSLTSIISNAKTAPTIKNDTFKNIKTGGTLTVPNGSSGYDVWMGTGNYYLGKYNWTKVER